MPTPSDPNSLRSQLHTVLMTIGGAAFMVVALGVAIFVSVYDPFDVPATANDIEYFGAGPHGDASALNYLANRALGTGGPWTIADDAMALTMFATIEDGQPVPICSIRYGFDGNLRPSDHADLFGPMEGAETQFALHFTTLRDSPCFAAPGDYEEWLASNGGDPTIQLIVAVKDGEVFEYVPSAGGWTSQGTPDEYAAGSKLAASALVPIEGGVPSMFSYEIRW